MQEAGSGTNPFASRQNQFECVFVCLGLSALSNVISDDIFAMGYLTSVYSRIIFNAVTILCTADIGLLCCMQCAICSVHPHTCLLVSSVGIRTRILQKVPRPFASYCFKHNL